MLGYATLGLFGKVESLLYQADIVVQCNLSYKLLCRYWLNCGLYFVRIMVFKRWYVSSSAERSNA